MNRKKRFAYILIILAVAAGICTALFLNGRNKSYDYLSKSFVAMGTLITEKVYYSGDEEPIEEITDIINSLDTIISWRNEISSVALLNKTGSVTDSTVADALTCLGKISELSGGVFDVTIGEISQLWSIGEESERIPSESEIAAALENVDYSSVKINGSTVTLSKNSQIDLGAVGKGYACDFVKAYLEKSEVKGAIVSVGGSILAYGDYNEAGDDWRIAIQHPRNESSYLGILSIDEGFVSTSGDYERYFEKDGTRYHHIINAETGYPASSGIISVTVVCDSGIISDALSTACFILGYENSLELLESYGASAIFVDEELNIKTVGELNFESY